MTKHNHTECRPCSTSCPVYEMGVRAFAPFEPTPNPELSMQCQHDFTFLRTRKHYIDYPAINIDVFYCKRCCEVKEVKQHLGEVKEV